jgi:ubiquinone/menaquinone biosynthesis C-methylase UbiE
VATVFMKWLERSPRMYERGIRLLTFGRLSKLWDQVVDDFIQPGIRVLELGCGTGGLTRRMAQAGADVNAIDVAPGMLSIAMDEVKEAGIANRVAFKPLDATQVGDHYPDASFDLIVASLMMSELTLQERSLVLGTCGKILTTDGKLVLLDEVIPHTFFNRWLYYLFHVPLAIITWLLTRTSTHPLRELEDLLQQHGFMIERKTCTLAGSLCIISASPLSESLKARAPVKQERLKHKITLRTLLLDLWALFFRIIPPYPKVKPGLYTIGHPAPDSPVFVTGNYDLTVRRVVKSLDEKIHAWLLVVNSGGINVWCAAGGGFLTSDKIISGIHMTRLEEIVTQRQLILPQLSAVGVDGNDIREKTGWSVQWGPVRAEDIPRYVADGFRKSDDMRSVEFPILARLEMVSGTLGFYALLVLVPVGIFWRSMLLPIAITMIVLSYFYALLMPWIPGKDGLVKSIPLATIAILGVIIYSIVWDPVSAAEMFNRVMGITALSVFIAGEFQGMSPLMRGEQANWAPEALIAVVLGLVYWLLPKFVGWR